MDHMKEIKAYATQYQDGLITHGEMIMKILENLVQHYEDNPASEFADKLSAQLLKD